LVWEIAIIFLARRMRSVDVVEFITVVDVVGVGFIVVVVVGGSTRGGALVHAGRWGETMRVVWACGVDTAAAGVAGRRRGDGGGVGVGMGVGVPCGCGLPTDGDRPRNRPRDRPRQKKATDAGDGDGNGDGD
jgi:hypothetical protein